MGTKKWFEAGWYMPAEKKRLERNRRKLRFAGYNTKLVKKLDSWILMAKRKK